MRKAKTERLMWLATLLVLGMFVGLGTPTILFATEENPTLSDREPASMPLSPKDNWDLQKLLQLTAEQVVELWSSAPAAPMSELNGHYMGLVPNHGDPESQLKTQDFMYDEASPRGYWLGKAFTPTSSTEGIGYNRWRFPGGKVVRNGRYSTKMGNSLIDGKPALMMFYGTYNPNSEFLSTLVDEIRKLNDYVYIGRGTRALEDGSRTPEAGHFLLIGPTDEWVGVTDF